MKYKNKDEYYLSKIRELKKTIEQMYNAVEKRRKVCTEQRKAIKDDYEQYGILSTQEDILEDLKIDLQSIIKGG